MQIGSLLQIQVKPKARSYRADLISQIYDVYNCEQETKLRKLKNIEKYKEWLREKRLRHSIEHSLKFKVSKFFIKEMSAKDIAICLSHVEQDDLFVVLSNCKDKKARGFSTGAYIGGLRVYKKWG